MSIVDRETHIARPLGAARLSGARISIELVSPKSITIGKKRYRAGDVVKRVTTKANGRAETGAHALPRGTYRLKMQKAPRGYLLDKSWKPTVKIRANGKIHLVEVLALQAVRGDARLSDVFGKTGSRSGPTAFLVTGKASGEQHVLVANGGRIDTSTKAIPHTQDTNANDALLAAGEDAGNTPPGSRDDGVIQTRFVQKASIGKQFTFPTLGASLGSTTASDDLQKTADAHEDGGAQNGKSGDDPDAAEPAEESGDTPIASEEDDAPEQSSAPDEPASASDGEAEDGEDDDTTDADEVAPDPNGVDDDATDADEVAPDPNGVDDEVGESSDEGGDGDETPAEPDGEASGDADAPETDGAELDEDPPDGPADEPGDENGTPEPTNDDAGNGEPNDAGDPPDTESPTQGNDAAHPDPARLGANDIAAAIRNVMDAESVEIDGASELDDAIDAASACEDIPFTVRITAGGKENAVRLIATPQEDGSIVVRDALTDDELVFIDPSGNVEAGTTDSTQTDGSGNDDAGGGTAEGQQETGASEEPGESSSEAPDTTPTGDTIGESDESHGESAGDTPGAEPDTQSSEDPPALENPNGNESGEEEGEDGADAETPVQSDAPSSQAVSGDDGWTLSGEPVDSDGESGSGGAKSRIDSALNKAKADEAETSGTSMETTGDERQAEPDTQAGVWFSGSVEMQTEPDNALGALPFDTYTFQELPSTSNAGMELASFEVEISGDKGKRPRTTSTTEAVAKQDADKRALTAAKPAKAQAKAATTSPAQSTHPNGSGTSSGKGGLFDQTGNLLGNYWWAFALIGSIGICAGAYATSLRRPEYSSWGPTSGIGSN